MLPCLLLAPTLAAPAPAKTLAIAAAADLQPVLPSLVANFERTTGDKVTVSYASSATLATQIINGAPYDLFLAANRAFPQRVVRAGLTIESQPVDYARGTLVLWARHGVLSGPLTMQGLTNPGVHHIAVANPQHAPYGAAAMAAMHSAGLIAALQPKLVFAENIAQAAQFAQSGNAECALISETLAIIPALQQAGSFAVVPRTSYPPLEQAGVIMRKAPGKQAAQDFLAYLLSPSGGRLLASGGLEPVSTAY